MKLIHLSDLHIGKNVNQIPMLEDQKLILKQILEIIEEEKPDAVLISGDLYDRKQPSVEAVKVVDDLLFKLSKLDTETFVLCGNHDAPERIAYAYRLIENSGVHMSPIYDGTVKPFTLTDKHGELCVYMLPFIKPVFVKNVFQNSRISTYTDAVKKAVKEMNIDKTKRNVLLAHQFITGAEQCDSEYTVGGLDNVDADVFEGFDYVALGHLHGPQNVVENRVRYCGSPLPYSFSEEHQKKSITIVEIEEKGQVSVNEKPLKLLHKFQTIKGTFDEVVSEYENRKLTDYVRVILTDEEPIVNVNKRLKNIFENLMVVSYDNARTRRECSKITAVQTKDLSPFEIVCKLFVEMTGTPVNNRECEYLEKVIKRVEEGNI